MILHIVRHWTAVNESTNKQINVQYRKSVQYTGLGWKMVPLKPLRIPLFLLKELPARWDRSKWPTGSIGAVAQEAANCSERIDNLHIVIWQSYS